MNAPVNQTQVIAVDPKKLHQLLADAKAGKKNKSEAIKTILASGNRAVIRSLPELSLFSEEEQEAIAHWCAMAAVEDRDITQRDFAFHLLLNCKIDPEVIVGLLFEFPTPTRRVLERIEKVIKDAESEALFCECLRKSAKELLVSTEPQVRDHGKHLLISAARTEKEWMDLAGKLSGEFEDLRSKIFYRFLNACTNKCALEAFVTSVARSCEREIEGKPVWIITNVIIQYMFFLLHGYHKLGWQSSLFQSARFLERRYDRDLPRKIQEEIKILLKRK